MDLVSDSGTSEQAPALIVATRLRTACGRVHCSCEATGLEEFFAFAAQQHHMDVGNVQPLVDDYLQSVQPPLAAAPRIPQFVMETSERILSRPSDFIEGFQAFRRTRDNIPLNVTAT
jgi:hypothetical protein